MARQFGLLPGCGRRVHLAAKGVNAVLQFGDLAAGRVVGFAGFHLGDLPLNLFQFLLYFFGGCHCRQIGA